MNKKQWLNGLFCKVQDKGIPARVVAAAPREIAAAAFILFLARVSLFFSGGHCWDSTHRRSLQSISSFAGVVPLSLSSIPTQHCNACIWAHYFPYKVADGRLAAYSTAMANTSIYSRTWHDNGTTMVIRSWGIPFWSEITIHALLRVTLVLLACVCSSRSRCICTRSNRATEGRVLHVRLAYKGRQSSAFSLVHALLHRVGW